jgi:hypothetical protein
MRTIGGLVPSIAGTSAVASVYIGPYLSSDAWRGNFIQALSLFGAMFRAFATTATSFHLGAAVVGGQGVQPGPQDVAADAGQASLTGVDVTCVGAGDAVVGMAAHPGEGVSRPAEAVDAVDGDRGWVPAEAVP